LSEKLVADAVVLEPFDVGAAPAHQAGVPTIALTASADTYNPTPNTAWFITLRSRACIGLGALDEAIPRPNDGGMMQKGKLTVTPAKMRAGRRVGDLSHCGVTIATRASANSTPIA